MKKHELLQKAMRDFPHGTKYWWPKDSEPKEFVSSGVFYFDEEDMITEICNEQATVYNGNKWAEIIKAEYNHLQPVTVSAQKTTLEIIEEPKMIVRSFDGIPLSIGDKCYVIVKRLRGWEFDHHGQPCVQSDDLFTVSDNGHFQHTDQKKIFSSRLAALRFVEEQNKSKWLSVNLFNGGAATVYIDHIIIQGGVKLSPSDLEDLTQAFNKLQQ